jgi:hypothetical protein
MKEPVVTPTYIGRSFQSYCSSMWTTLGLLNREWMGSMGDFSQNDQTTIHRIIIQRFRPIQWFIYPIDVWMK